MMASYPARRGDNPGSNEARPGRKFGMTEEQGDGATQRLLRRADAVQRGHPALAFPFAVLKKYSDDRAGQLAALISYYGFFSLFPLLLIFTTIVSLVVRNDAELQQALLDSALSKFPVVGTQIQRSIGHLSGSTVTLVVGGVVALWAGTAVVSAAQSAMDDVWDVPRAERPGLVRRVIRALLLLLVFGGSIAASTFLTGIEVRTGWTSVVWESLFLLSSVAISVGVFAFAYRMLTVANVRWKEVLPGAVVAAIAWTVLLLLGSWLVDRHIRQATAVYGALAWVIGLLAWIALAAQVFLIGAEINVVRVRRLWPRSLTEPSRNPPDRRALAGAVREERADDEERVDVRFDEPARDGDGR
jgi:YihY family inner membrane protein